MKISRQCLDKIRAEAPAFGYKPRPISIQTRIRESTRKVRDDIKNNHSVALLLLEESIRVVLSFENYQYSRDMCEKETTSFLLQLSRIRSDLIAIHLLLTTGQETSALAIARVFIENIELTMAATIDLNFSNDYFELSSENSFWSKRIGYGKLYPLVEKFISHGTSDEQEAKNYIQHHRELKTFLSAHIHPSIESALSTVFPSVIDPPRLFKNRPLGWFGINSGRLCLFIAEEIHMFSACCINMFIRPDPPPALSGFQPDKHLAAFMVPAGTLQELIIRYARRMHSYYEQQRINQENALLKHSDDD